MQTSQSKNDLKVSITLLKKHEVCPVCFSNEINVHGYKERVINHAVLDHIKCTLHYKARRYQCKICKKTFFEKNSFVAPGQRISNYTLLKILRELKIPNYTFANVANNTGLTKTAVMDIFDQYVEFKRGSMPEYLCIDEVYYSRHSKEKYNCVLFDFRNNKIVDVLSSRRKDHLRRYFEAIPKKERLRVRYISIDMWNPYRDLCNLYFEKAIISVDAFHVSSTVTKALQDVRIRVMKNYAQDSREYYLLKNWNWLIVKNESDIEYNTPKWNRKLKRYANLSQILELILEIDEEIKEAWSLKEDFIHFFNLNPEKDIRSKFIGIKDKFHNSRIKEYNKVNSMFNNWGNEIINSFHVVDQRRFTSGPLESMNARIKLIKRNGGGYTNFSRYRARILYCLNKDANPDLTASNKPKGSSKSR